MTNAVLYLSALHGALDNTDDYTVDAFQSHSKWYYQFINQNTYQSGGRKKDRRPFHVTPLPLFFTP